MRLPSEALIFTQGRLNAAKINDDQKKNPTGPSRWKCLEDDPQQHKSHTAVSTSGSTGRSLRTDESVSSLYVEELRVQARDAEGQGPGVCLGSRGHPSSRQEADALAVSRSGGEGHPGGQHCPFLPAQGEAAPPHSPEGLAGVRCLQFSSPSRKGRPARRP